MRELSAVREGWDAFEVEHTRLLRSLTVQESLRQWLELQRAFEPQLQETAALFAQERRSALAELQARLQRLAEWQRQNAESIEVSPDAATPSE